MRFPSRHRWSAIRNAAVAGAAVLALGACDRNSDKSAADDGARSNTDSGNAELANEMNWARAALQRNPDLELLATDRQSNVFTVRIKRTGETQAIKLTDLVAGPATQLAASQTPAASAATTTPASQSTAPNAAAALVDSTPAKEPSQAASSAATASAADGKGYTIERSDGQTRISGPGVSIVSSGIAATTRESDAGQRSVDPMICEGHRMLHFDNRNIYVDGDAIVARGGCELYITNSRIVAAGIGVVVQDAIVHISNSTIEGNTASFDASDAAKVYLRASTFQGLPRRGEKAVVQDQGGNHWR